MAGSRENPLHRSPYRDSVEGATTASSRYRTDTSFECTDWSPVCRSPFLEPNVPHVGKPLNHHCILNWPDAPLVGPLIDLTASCGLNGLLSGDKRNSSSAGKFYPA
jgi:hypothetical protein